MKRTIGAVLTIILVVGLFFLVHSQFLSNQPEEGNTQVALCRANVYSGPALTGEVEVLASLHKGDEFTLTGRRASAGNGKGASYTMWEGTTASGTIGWVKANAFTETDKYGY